MRLITSAWFAWAISAHGQAPGYTIKKFVATHDTLEFPITPAPENGSVKSYILTEPEIWDVDDAGSTHVRGGMRALLVVEGENRNGAREGVFRWYLIDEHDHTKRWRIWEQTYLHDRLDGEWRTYNLKGTKVNVRNYVKGREVSYTEYWIDGTTPVMERTRLDDAGTVRLREYGGQPNHLEREITLRDSVPHGLTRQYYPNGQLHRETNHVDGVLEGPGRAYYPDGTLQEELYFTKGDYDKTKKYYHPNGQLWVEHEYRLGKPWNAIASFDSMGNKRDPGTLREGTGTLIYYNDDGTVRERVNYVGGVQR